jgi:hypothetical protein
MASFVLEVFPRAKPDYVTRPSLVFCRIARSKHVFLKHSTNTDTHTCMSTHHYEYTHLQPIPMSTSERLSRLDFEIHEVGHQERLAVDGDVASY